MIRKYMHVHAYMSYTCCIHVGTCKIISLIIIINNKVDVGMYM